VEELSTQLPLKLGNLVTQRRLHDEASFRRAGEVAELGHGDDVLQLLEVHAAIVNRDQSHDNKALESSLSMPQAGGMRPPPAAKPRDDCRARRESA
jgi:hypothetical protein